MPKDFDTLELSNPSPNPAVHALTDPTRRRWLHGGVAAVGALWAGGGVLSVSGCAVPAASEGTESSSVAAATAGTKLGFASVPMSAGDVLVVPRGYRAQVLYRWGDPVGLPGDMPLFRPDASNSAREQAAQAGMHHDGMAFFPLGDGASRGVLAINHEYVDDDLLHTDGRQTWSAEKAFKSMAAHGVSVVEVARVGGGWQVVAPSLLARRITATTPMRMAGPAAGHALLRTAADPKGERVLGTFNNCASGQTPWGTYLTCEENFADYFEGPAQPDAHQQRWGLRSGRGALMRWHEADERFDMRRHPNEPNRFGWVVEIDPMDPQSTPVKRTALGRAAHEGAATAVTARGQVVVYMGEDARFEYIYKFVSRDALRPGGYAANRELLDHGTLYVARFDGDGRGRWLPLTHGTGPLVAEHGFADQGEVLIKTRQASDLLGATKMDRPEWTAVDPRTKHVYCTLTNNAARGQPGMPGADAANPRAPNPMGQIIRWQEDGDFDGAAFTWEHLMLAGDPHQPRETARGNVVGDAFGSPDGLWVDPRGVLWIQTDVSSSALGRGDYSGLPNNQMLACDPSDPRREVRRFLVGPTGCEVTGAAMTPDMRTLFVNIQHPGEGGGSADNPAAPAWRSRWPDGGRPRSATVVVTKADGGVIGT